MRIYAKRNTQCTVRRQSVLLSEAVVTVVQAEYFIIICLRIYANVYGCTTRRSNPVPEHHRQNNNEPHIHYTRFIRPFIVDNW